MGKERRDRSKNGEDKPKAKRTEDSKRKARTEATEAIRYCNKVGQEKGITPIPAKEYDNKKNIGQKLAEVKKIEKQKVRELKKIGKEITKEIKSGVKSLSIQKLELTRKECEEMGIFIQSDVAFGSYAKLDDANKELINKEIAGALLEKGLKLLNSCFDEEKMASASLKDSAIATSIIFDKMAMFNGKADKLVKVEHSLNTLIQNNSEKQKSMK